MDTKFTFFSPGENSKDGGSIEAAGTKAHHEAICRIDEYFIIIKPCLTANLKYLLMNRAVL